MKKIILKGIFPSLLIMTYFASCAGNPEVQAEKVENIREIPLEEESDFESKKEDAVKEVFEEIEVIEEPEIFESETPEEEEIILEPVEDEEGFFMSDKTVLEENSSQEIPETEVETESENETEDYQNDSYIEINPENYKEGETYSEHYYATPSDNNEENSSPYLNYDPFNGMDFSESEGTDDDFTENYHEDDFENSLNEENNDAEERDIKENEGNNFLNTENSIENNNDESEDEINDTEETYDSEEEETIEEVAEKIIPSRSVTIKKNQYLEVIYPGSGWVYLGENDETEFLRYFGRKRNSGKTSFTLRARDEGKTIIHFYKNDSLTGQYIDDYLEVIISGSDKSESKITAPSYEEIVPPAPKSRKKLSEKTSSNNVEKNEIAESSSIDINPYGSYETGNQNDLNKNSINNENKKRNLSDTKEDDIATVIQKSDTSEKRDKNKKIYKNESSANNFESSDKNQNDENINTEGLTSDELLSKAQECFNNKEYEKTLELLDAFFNKATEKIDSGLFLQAQTYESNSSVKNIKNALDTYETIVKDYPQSINWAKAYERMTYLKRFYFNIR